MVYLLRGEFLSDQPADLSGCGERVAIATYFDRGFVERLRQQPAQPADREAPQLAGDHPIHAHARYSDEEDAPRPQHPMELRNGASNVTDHVQDMRADDAIKAIGR